MEENERQKLKQRYADMSDGDLSDLLKDGEAGLVQGAYELVRDEAIKRKLVVQEKIISAAIEPEPSKSTKVGVKPLNEFGGWLTFFYLSLWVKLVLFLGESLLWLVKLMNRTAFIPFALEYFFEYLLLSMVIVNMLKIVKKPDPTVPNKMFLLLLLYLLFFLMFAGIQALVSRLTNHPIGAYSGSGDLTWGCLFIPYFFQAKRVKAYYGVNAEGNNQKELGSVLINLLPNCWRS